MLESSVDDIILGSNAPRSAFPTQAKPVELVQPSSRFMQSLRNNAILLSIFHAKRVQDSPRFVTGRIPRLCQAKECIPLREC